MHSKPISFLKGNKEMSEKTPARPKSITVVVILNAINSMLMLVAGYFLSADGLKVGTIFLSFGILTIISLVGVWMMRYWAWFLLIIMSVLGIPLSIYGIVGSGGSDPGTYLSGILAIYTLYALLSKGMREHFS